MSETASLFTAIRAGDRNAYEELVGREWRHLLGIAYRITGDASLAEDVVQATFLKLLEGRARLVDDAAGSAWLGRVAARLAIDELRKRASLRRREEARALERARRDEGPGDALMDSEQARLVAEALAALSPETRAAVWLHVAEGNTVREVAAALETPRSTVNRRIQMGIKHLQSHLRRVGIILPLGASLGQLLAELPVPQPSPGLLARIEVLIDAAGAPAPASAGSGESEGLGAARRSVVLPVTAGVALLAVMGVVLWLVLGRGVRPEVALRVDDGPLPPPVPAQAASDPAPRLEVVPPSRVILSGRVVDERGAARGGADVVAYEDFTLAPLDALLLEWKFLDLLERALDAPEPIARTRARDDGAFEIEMDPGKPVKLLAFSPFEGGIDSGSVRARAPGPEGSAPAQAPVEIVMLPAAPLTGRVAAEDGSPLPGARVIALAWPRTYQGRDLTVDDVEAVLRMYVPRHDTTKADGAFTIPALPTPERHYLKVFARAPGRATVQSDVGTVIPTDPLELVLPPATAMPGKVVHMPEGRPAAGARVVAFREPFGDNGWFSFATAGASGEFVLQGHAETGIKVLAKITGSMFPRRVFIDPGELKLPILIDITSGTAIRGTVRNADGKPMAGIRLLCRDMAGPHISASTTSGEDGTYTIGGISWSAKCQIVTDTPGFIRKDLAIRWPSQEDPEVILDIDLVPTATLRGRVVGATGAPLADVTVEAVTVVDSTWDALALRWAREMRGQGPVRTADDGAFTLEEVPPHGKLFLWAYHPEHGEKLVAHDAEGGARDGIAIALEGGAGLRVRCTDLRGDPLDRMVVMLDALAVPEFIPVGAGKMAFYYQRTSLDMTFIEDSEGNVPCQRHAQTHAEGTVEWRDVLPGRQRVSIMEFTEGLASEEEGYWIFTGITSEALEPGQVVELPVVLDTSHAIGGKVVDRAGSGIPSLLVHALSARKDHAGLEDVLHHAVGPTDDEGRFRLEGLGPGPYRVKVSPVARNARGLRDVLHDARDVSGEDVTIVIDPPAATEPR